MEELDVAKIPCSSLEIISDMERLDIHADNESCFSKSNPGLSRMVSWTIGVLPNF